MLSDAKVDEVRAYLATIPPGADVFIGCDSSRHRDSQNVWWASYTTVVVISKLDEVGRRSGCRVFTTTDKAVDYDQKKNRPMMRMQNEAYRSVEAYQQLEYDLIDHEVEIHLDINDDPRHGSNCARSSAVGYVTGVTGLPVKTKPDAWAATHVADHGVRGKFDHERRAH